MIHLHYDLETQDEIKQARCCGLCAHGYYDIDRGNMCRRERDQVDCGNLMWPNDCANYEPPSLSRSRCRCAEDRVFNRITTKLNEESRTNRH